jgi:DNA-nicking Smr family endonuclease
MSTRKQQEKQARPPTFQNSKLKEQLARWKSDKAEEKASPPKPRAVHLPPPPPRNPAALNESTEESLFRAAMGDVAPLPRAHSDASPPLVRRTAQEVDEEAEALAQLAELVATGEGLDLTDTDEHIEGIARNVDHGLLNNLRAGEFSVQAHLDLHGLLAPDAHTELERFLVESRKRGHRCVLVIHGRGLHSKDQEPVLKSRMGPWLSRGKLARIVLAFATARPVDGGAGALYVLLRR